MNRSIPHPIEIVYGGGAGLACGLDGELHADQLHGLFAGDTRMLSTWRFAIAGHAWRVLARARPGPSTAQWDMQNPTIRVPGGEIDEGTIHFRLRRRVSGALHDDLAVCSFAPRPVPVRLSLYIDADFADLFQVKERSTPPRLNVSRVPRKGGLSLVYERRGFRRGLHVSLEFSGGTISFVGAQIVFDVVLEPRKGWTCCVHAVPDIDGSRLEFQGDPHGPDEWRGGPPSAIVDADPVLLAPLSRGWGDLDRLAVHEDGDPPFIAAGAPWFLALFGRDTLVTSLMAGLLGAWHTRGALAGLGRLQARARDDFRDAEPGKIPHEMRRGELARFGIVPHSPYYGTHDAPALYVLALWNAFRWTGDRELLERHLPAACAAMRWCDTGGDPDGDGLLEYITRSRKGYRHQGWKDAGDAVPHEDGRQAEPPIATVELQGYLFAARRALAELLEAAGRNGQAEGLRASAKALRERVEERFWMEDAGFYALALDRDKRLVRSVSSNPGHLLWCGLPSPDRARRVASRLLAADMFSGYGVRTLSAGHPCYNPLSYQLGSVWPHDNALLAAGLMRYGFRDEAARVIKAILDAAATFEQDRLPELFCGFPKDDGAPVPYEKANVPQAWAAAAPILAAQLFLGLLPDAPNARCCIAPWLPDWLPRLEVRGVRVGDGDLEVGLRRQGPETRIEHARHHTLEIVEGLPAAPLWGRTD